MKGRVPPPDSADPLRHGSASSPKSMVAPCLSRDGGGCWTVRHEGAEATLSPRSAALLAILATAQATMSLAEIGCALAVRTRVDMASNVRDAASHLRRELAAAGLGELVISERGAGYRLARGVSVDGLPPLRRRGAIVSLDRSKWFDWNAAKSLLLAQANGTATSLPGSEGILAIESIVVDLDDLRLVVSGREFATGSARDFAFLAAIVISRGALVSVQDLLALCQYDVGPYALEVVLRAARRLNRQLRRVDVPLRLTAGAGGAKSCRMPEAA